jgi:beta-lactamase regulating signal transducer with metallopeptidase domain
VNFFISSLNALAQAFAGQIGNCLAGGTVILLFAGLCSHLLRQGNSRTRFAVWFTGLLAIGMVPLFAIVWSLETSRVLPAGTGGAAAITLPHAWALDLFVAWAVIAGIGLTRIVVGFWQVCVLRSRSARLDPRNLAPELRETLTQLQPARAVALLLSDEIQSPTAIGLLSPAIVLPRWLLDELSTTELQQILLHELAHLRRWDDWSNLLQKIVKALFFFHPAVWWMERQISLEREMACDEAVLAQTGNPRAYAQCLVRLAEKSFFRRSVMLAQAAVSRIGQTSRRVARILGAGRPSDTGMRKLVTPSFAAALIACLGLLARAPKLIAFEDNPDAAKFLQAHAAPTPVVQASLASAANVPAKSLAKISSGSLHPYAVAAGHSCLKPPRQNRVTGGVVDAKLLLKGNRLSATMVKEVRYPEVVVVFVESRWNNSAAQAVWQIELWHVTMLRTEKNPVPQPTPQKVI